MPRIPVVTPENATEEQTAVLTTVKSKMGGVPNILGAMTQSPAVANAYLSMSGALGQGSLTGRLREQIALAVGQLNSCDYCVAAHTQIGKGAGLTVEETVAARRVSATEEKEQVALNFVKKLVTDRANVSDEDVDAVRNAGYTDGEVAELVANTALNLFTNYFNHVAGTEVDFPTPPSLEG